MTNDDDSINNNNPLLSSWSNEPFNLPPFSKIQPHHFPPAFAVAMGEHMEELRTIASSSTPPTFENTIAAYDRAGSTLSKISAVFSNYCSSINTDEMKSIQTEMTPLLSRHSSTTYTLPGLFSRIETVKQQEDDSTTLTPEQRRLIERIHLDFTRQGAHFTPEAQEEYANLKSRLASLQTQFMQNVMTDEEQVTVPLTLEEMDGCPPELVSAAKSDDGSYYAASLARSFVEPFLTSATSRAARERVFSAWSSRGTYPDRRNAPLAVEMLRLRRRQAEMHGYESFAEYQCVDRMAKTPAAVMNLLEDVWERAVAAAERERGELEEEKKKEGGGGGGIEPWDWRYYAEKVRRAKYDFDETSMRPYLSLKAVTDAVMGVSNKLYGLRYVKREDVESYHPDVTTYEVHDDSKEDDSLLAIFFHDNYARKYKSGGAWMSSFREQTKNHATATTHSSTIPIIANNNNFIPSSTKSLSSTLLSPDDATTLFHEMGHGHHGMLSDATYKRLSGTSVLSDFVELPSQLMERWFERPEVLSEYARHYETGEVMPMALMERWKKAKSFNVGFDTVEYVSCALIDMALHDLSDEELSDDNFDLEAFEKATLEKWGMPQGIIMRHRPCHFLHLFATSSYAAGYYVYLWAEVLDADAFAAFEETGNVFDKDVARKAREFIYAAGNTVAPDELFRRFRGRDPDVKFMLEKKGLL